jgi:phosphoribosylformylglycinamidine cyclo-ligase
MSSAYKSAGVDIEAGYEAVARMKKHIQKTMRPGVMGAVGGFGGLFDLGVLSVKEPVLVSGTDGVGTKLKLAFATEKHDTIGIDAVAMCVNDIVTQGAQPLFFLDYIACGKLDPRQIEDIVKGVSEGCVQAGCALIGGETAEMPGLYSEDEYDIAGFAVGVVEKKSIITGESISEGDVLVGLASSGTHSNGYSLIKKIVTDNGLSLDTVYDGFDRPLGEVLLTPTRIYVKTVLDILADVQVKGMAHITGGGFIENIPRVIPKGLGVLVEKGSWKVPGIFPFLQNHGRIQEEEMYNVFNMGIGMVLVVKEQDVSAVMAKVGEGEAFVIGKVVPGDGVTFS